MNEFLNKWYTICSINRLLKS